MLTITTLGGLSIRLDGEPVTGLASRKAEALLVYLACSERRRPREVLAELLWEERAQDRAMSNLRVVLSSLRKQLSPYVIITRDTAVLNPDADIRLDAAELEEKLSTGQLEEAVSLYHADCLQGFFVRGSPGFEDWAAVERERLRQLVLKALRDLTAHTVDIGDYDAGIRHAARWLELDPLVEEAHRQMMRLLAFSGQRGAALEQYETCRQVLQRELAVEPMSETTVLYEQIQAGELEPPILVPGPDLPPQPPAPGEPPFKGLEFFDVADADLFFGREILTARLVDRLRGDDRFLAVVGTSGSGKSSLVRAGLVAALQQSAPLADGRLPPKGSDRWPALIITPTVRPLESLAVSLTRDVESVTVTATLIDDLTRDPRSLHLYVRKTLAPSAYRARRHLLLVVDQFEELFTQCRDLTERKAFVDNLLTAAGLSSSAHAQAEDDGWDEGPTVVVITLRADFYHHCAQYENLRQALGSYQEYIGPMTQEELRQAIEEPAQRNGWDFEPGLVDLLLRDVGDEPGALPLLSHALLETWKRRRGHTLTLGGYAEAGGVHSAIAKTAEAVYHGLDERQQAIARNIFLRLTELGEGTQDTRRRAGLDELFPQPEEAAAVETVLYTLVDARLITTERDTVQVAHEALIREWPTLREWLEEDREGLRVHRHLTEAAQEWDRLDRDPGELYRGTRLAQGSEWASAHSEALNPLEREFLAASEEWAWRREKEREQRRRRITLAAAGAAMIFLILAVFGGAGWRQAEGLRQEAEVGRQVALSRQLVAQSVNQLGADNYATALLLAIEAGRAAKTAEAASLLHDIFARLGYPIVTLSGHTDGVRWAVWSSDESRILTASSDGTARVWDGGTGAELITLSGHTAGVGQAVWNRDENRILTAGQDGTARVWDAGTGSELVMLSSHTDAVQQAVWTSDESRILTASSDGTARVWDARTGAELLTLSGHDGAVNQATWNGDESRVLTAGADGTARVWDAATGVELLILSGHSRAVNRAVWNGDGSRILTASDDGSARLWDADTGTELVTYFGHAAPVNHVVWNSDESRILTASSDVTARVWDAGTGTRLVTLSGHAEAVWQAAWNRGESRILTVSSDGTARVWDAETGADLLILSGHAGGISQAVWSGGGSRVLTAGYDGTAQVWDAEMGGELATLSGHGRGVNQAVWNGDTSRILTAGQDRTARVWDAETGAELLTLLGHAGEVRQAVWNSDESRILTASRDGTARVWDAETGAELLTLSFRGAAIVSDPWGLRAVWDSNESRILTAGDDGTVRLWDAEAGAELLTLFVSENTVLQAAWNSDESRILTASRDGTARVWDAETGVGLVILSGHTGPVNQAVWNSDQNRILTAGVDGTARVWDVASLRQTQDDAALGTGAETGVELLTLIGHSDEIWSAVWSDDDSYILTASSDGTARVWDAATGTGLLTLSGHTDQVNQAVWNGDESRILTASSDGTVRVWDATTGAELFALSGHTDEVNQAVWSGDDEHILTASSDGTVRQWYARMEDLLEAACQRAPRNMTREEWGEFMKDEPYRPTCPDLPVPEA